GSTSFAAPIGHCLSGSKCQKRDCYSWNHTIACNATQRNKLFAVTGVRELATVRRPARKALLNNTPRLSVSRQALGDLHSAAERKSGEISALRGLVAIHLSDLDVNLPASSSRFLPNDCCVDTRDTRVHQGVPRTLDLFFVSQD